MVDIVPRHSSHAISGSTNAYICVPYSDSQTHEYLLSGLPDDHMDALPNESER